MPEPRKRTLVQRVTRILIGPSQSELMPMVVVPTQPAESEEQRQQRLEAYRKLCEQEPSRDPESTGKAIKYRSDTRS